MYKIHSRNFHLQNPSTINSHLFCSSFLTLQLISYNFPKYCVLRSELRCEVQKFILKFTSPYVNKVSDWSLNKSKPIRGFVYIRACEFQYELLNFATKFGTKYAIFREKLYEINCKHARRTAYKRTDDAKYYIAFALSVLGYYTFH